jgi:CBS domain containing-hemolysin-like protein
MFRAKSDALLGFFARTMKVLHELLRPFVNALVRISIWILRYIFNIKMDENAKPFTRIDLEHYYQQTKEANEDSQELNQELFENALSLSGIKIRSCLVPRTEVVGVPLEFTPEQARQKMVETRLSKIIVYNKNIDDIVGYIHQLDMLKNNESLQDILLPIPTVPETMSVTDLISKFSADRKSIAWVVDEFGGTAGIVTMEDLLEEIFGEIEDEYDIDENSEQKLSETEFVFSGRLELDHLSDKYKLALQAEKDAETLSGFIIKKNGTIPKIGDKIIVGNYRFEILQMSETRIDQVKLHIL